MFFDDYPKFLGTSSVAAHRGRLNLRYEALFAANRDILEGARVLDLASHDGRWSFAALRTGAAHVTGVEARPDLVDSARENLSYYGEDPNSYRFLSGDMFEVLAREKLEVDVVLCLGYIYHTYRHTELFYYLRQLNPDYLVVDCSVIPRFTAPVVKLFRDQADEPAQAVLDPYSHDGATLVGRPSVPALRMMLQAYDFGVEDTYDWDGLMSAHPEIAKPDDYTNGRRVTMRCRSGLSADDTGVATTGGGATANTVGSSDAAFTAKAAGPASSEVDPAPVTAGSRWRDLVNRGLASATGYELRRSSRGR